MGDNEMNRSSQGEQTGTHLDRERKRKAEEFDAADPDRQEKPSRERHPKDYKFLSETMRKAFSEEEYSKLVAALPQWETTLESFSADSIFFYLEKREFEGSLVKTQAIRDYLHPTPLAKQLADAVCAGLHEEAIAVLERVAQDESLWIIKDDKYVRPEHFPHSWARDEWQLKLFEGRMNLDGLAKTSKTTDYRIIGIWAGTGNGKSHRLMELQDFHPHKLLPEYEADRRNEELTEGQRQLVENVPAVDCFIYVTYNMGQTLEFDRDCARQAIILRIMLRGMGLPNNGCNKFFAENARTLANVDADRLRQVCVEYFRAKKNAQHVGIAVDELRMLMLDRTHKSHPSIPVTMTRIGLLASALEEVGVRCTPLISSLASDILSSESGRPIYEVKPPLIGQESIQFIIEHADLPAKKKTAKNVSMVRAAAGCHFRSAILALRIVKENREITPTSLFSMLKKRMETRLQTIECEYIRQHVLGMMETGEGVKDHRQRFVDQQGAVAPAFVLAAFHKQKAFEENMHPAEKMFEVSAHADPTKQLELCGMYYDCLRALHKLPVVPCDILVETDEDVDFSEYRIDPGVAKRPVCPDTFLQGDGSGGFQVVPGWTPPTKKYMFPSSSNHMHVDRACVASHPGTRAKCLVIYQDKINARGFPDAVRSLEKAATLLKDHLGYPVLCVVVAAQASVVTTAQEIFTHPFILVRDSELDDYYTPTFAVPIRYLRSRHNFDSHEDPALVEASVEEGRD